MRRRTRSSPLRATSAPSVTSPGSSGNGVALQETRHAFRESLKELEKQTLGGLEIVVALEQMGQAARRQVVCCQRAFAERDVDLARALARDDEEINRLNRQIFRRAVDIGDDPELREWAMLMILVARALERIGDNTVDV